jgi:hypothetical protein
LLVNLDVILSDMAIGESKWRQSSLLTMVAHEHVGQSPQYFAKDSSPITTREASAVDM